LRRKYIDMIDSRSLSNAFPGRIPLGLGRN
jgi:hypothetical protein